jgi:hypothetical protein
MVRRFVYVPLLGALFGVHAAAHADLKTYQTKYYTLLTDLDDDGVRETKLRVTLMAEEYHRRTKGFAGSVDRALPFYLFRNAADYYKAGGFANTVGLFTGEKLLAWVSTADSAWTWRVVQHEGFHQFARAAMGRDPPPWANEGLAEYFGLGVFTGDDFRTGLIPPMQLAVVKHCIAEKRFVPMDEFMRTDQEIWNAQVKLDPHQAGPNYVQAWAMVYFLAHAENAKYQKAFTGYLRDVSRGVQPDEAWRANFGAGVAEFQKRFDQYWSEMPDNPSALEYAECTVATLTGFFARAFSQRQKFESADEFFKAGEAGNLKAHKEDWLPPALLRNALQVAPKTGAWSLRKSGGRQMLVCERDDGRIIEGSFKISGSRVHDVSVTTRARPKKP